MSGILNYFKKEKNYLRSAAHQFSMKFPKVAGYLNLGNYDSDDPQIERLLESFAYLTANLQQKMDAEFPEISTGLLGILNPNLISPIPSMAIAQINIEAGSIPPGSKEVLKSGTMMSMDTLQGIPCRFQSVYPVNLLPLSITEAVVESTDKYEFLEKQPNVACVLRLRISAQGEHILPDIDLTNLRIHLNGDPMVISSLYESLFTNVLQTAVFSDIDDTANIAQDALTPIFLAKDNIQQVGFKDDEAILPNHDNNHPAYRLIQEYFCFPDKFHFLDLKYLDTITAENHLDVLILLKDKLTHGITRETFLLGCTPIINLFKNTTGAIHLDHKRNEYPVIPSYGEEKYTEVHTVLEVGRSSKTYTDEIIRPFYGFNHNDTNTKKQAYWYTRREESYHQDFFGTDVFMSFKNLDFEDEEIPHETVFLKTLCTNRDLPSRVPGGAKMGLEEKGTATQAICLKKPTVQINPPLKGASLWKLISTLSLNYLSLSEGDNSLESLRSILLNYNFSGNSAIEQQIQGLRQMKCQKTINRIRYEGWRGYCKGLEVHLKVDDSYFVGSSAFLFSSVLNHFFGMFVSMNAFIETVISKTTIEGEWKRLKPITGNRELL